MLSNIKHFFLGMLYLKAFYSHFVELLSEAIGKMKIYHESDGDIYIMMKCLCVCL